MKIKIKHKNDVVTIDFCETENRQVNPMNLVPLDLGSSINPRKELGVFHNFVVAKLEEENVQFNTPDDLETLIRIGKSFTFSDPKNELDVDKFKEHFADKIFGGCIPPFPPVKYPGHFDDFLKNLFLSLGYEIRNFRGDSSDVHQIHQRLLAAEKTILENDQKKEDQLRSLAVVAIATKSLEYWHDEARGVDGSGTGASGVSQAAVDQFVRRSKMARDAEAYNEFSDIGEVIATLYAAKESYYAS
jgi:hypothetical protein